MGFPEKVFLFNHWADRVFPMVIQKDYVLDVKGSFQQVMACGVAEAYLFTRIQFSSSDLPKEGRITIKVDGETIVDRKPLRGYADEKPFEVDRRSSIMQAVPISNRPEEPFVLTGLFFTNGTMLDGILEGIPEATEVGMTFSMPIYKAIPGKEHPFGPRDWSPRIKAC